MHKCVRTTSNKKKQDGVRTMKCVLGIQDEISQPQMHNKQFVCPLFCMCFVELREVQIMSQGHRHVYIYMLILYICIYICIYIYVDMYPCGYIYI